jgi:protein phosphatase
MSAWIGIGRSEIGLVRSTNQDAFVTMNPLGLWAVADGMGGHVGGEVAAQTAIASIKAQAELTAEILRQGPDTPSAFLADLIMQAHRAILERANLEPSLKGMGTTVVLLLIHSLPAPMAHIAHLGDSRAYLFRSGTLTALTRDHTLIEKYLERGILTPKTARTHPERHVLTQALGVSSPVRPSISSHPLEPEDILLLCSDGLTKMLEDDHILDICSAAHGDPIQTCDGLINASLDRGGIDNVTVIVITRA